MIARARTGRSSLQLFHSTTRKGLLFLLLVFTALLPSKGLYAQGETQEVRTVLAESSPPAQILIDSKSGVPRTARSDRPFPIRAVDFGDEESLRLIFSASGYARQARFLNRSILEGGAEPFRLSKTELYHERLLITFDAYPPDASLYIREISGVGMQPQYWGRSAQVRVEDRYDLSQGKFLTLFLSIERDGYLPWRKEIAINSLAKPDQEVVNLGEIELRPGESLADRWEQWKVLHRFRTPVALFYDLLLVGFVASIPLVMLPRYRRHREERELWEKKRVLETVITDTDPLLKKTFGGYYLTARIGRGGMSKVYRGLPEHNLELEEAVAVKVIDEDLAKSEEFRARFRREIEVSASLTHSNIVKLIDWGEAGPLLYMVQELIEGQTLKETVKEPLSQARFLHVFLPILRALKTAHDRGIIHRDLKPSNIMITHTDVVKLMDFGLAKTDRPGHDLTRTGDAFGTPIYMSPEQISGGALDARADIYALGVMAFELLAGRLPFEASDDPMTVMLAHLQKEPRKLSEFRDDLSEELYAVVERMLHKDPKDRFQELSEVIAILDELPRIYHKSGSSGGVITG